MLSDFTYTMVGFIKDGMISNTLNRELDFTIADYEVAMLDMLFMPGSWDNVRDGMNYFTWQVMTADNKPIGDVKKIVIPPKNYTPITFQKVLKELVDDEWGVMQELQPGLHAHLKFGSGLAYMGGLIKNMIDPIPTFSYKPGDKSLQIWKNMDAWRNTLTMLWIFADFIGNTIIGDMQAPLLRFIPIKVGSGTMEHATFVTHQYCRVKPCKLTTLTIYISDNIQQRELKFWNTWSPIAITLHFRVRT